MSKSAAPPFSIVISSTHVPERSTRSRETCNKARDGPQWVEFNMGPYRMAPAAAPIHGALPSHRPRPRLQREILKVCSVIAGCVSAMRACVAPSLSWSNGEPQLGEPQLIYARNHELRVSSYLHVYLIPSSHPLYTNNPAG